MLNGDLLPSTDLCLGLLTAAIGSVVQYTSFHEVCETRPDAAYIERALSILPIVNMEFSLRSVQCLVLLTIYYNCIMKPCQAHDYILMASFKTQALFKWYASSLNTASSANQSSIISHFYPDDSVAQKLLRRLFWSILILETLVLGSSVHWSKTNNFIGNLLIILICLKVMPGSLTIVFSSQRSTNLGSPIRNIGITFLTKCDRVTIQRKHIS